MKINSFKHIIDMSLTKAIRKDLPILLERSVNKYIEKKSGKYPSTSSTLRSNSGRLVDSLKVGSSENIFNYKVSNNNIRFEYGTKVPYALIHEEGGEIFSKGNMHKYFWAMYFKTKETYYKNLALRVKSGKSLKIPKRPFLKPGMEYFMKKHLPGIINKYIKTVTENIIKNK